MAQKTNCADLPPSLFYPEFYFVQGRPKGGGPVPIHPDVLAAKAACAGCAAKQPCLERALELKEIDGIWGGTTPQERWVMMGHTTRVRADRRSAVA